MNISEVHKIPRLSNDKLPRGWESEIVSEEDSRIKPENWKLGQTGMVGNIIKPLDQTGAGTGEIRVIFIGEK